MALLKEITNDNGIKTTYHKIHNISARNGEMICSLDSYVSKDYRETNNPADSQMFIFYITLEEEESMGIRQLGYKKIKELPEWSDAADC